MEEEIDSETLLKNSTIYDMEVESESKRSRIEEIPKRMRFYHARIDTNILGSGQDYRHLKKVIVVMIMPFDPFGYDHMVYTIQNKCLEVPELPYDDGSKTLFLYTRGTKGNPTPALRELLCYMDHSQPENVKNDDLKSIHIMVNTVKDNAEVSKGFMKIFEKERFLKEEGREEGVILGVIKTCREFHVPEEEIQKKIMETYEVSEKYVKELCSMKE